MIAFDTNVLVRLLVEDDRRQFDAALALLERVAEARETCYLSDAVLCETVWVLTSVYRARRADVVGALTALTADPRYGFDDVEAVREAIEGYESGRADFADHLIGCRARRRGARTTYTFDRGLEGTEGFTLLR
jgi:predicted nucleic-acid-binding protein